MDPPVRKILIVDDDLDFVESLSSFLQTQGYVVLRALDGKEGLKVAKMERPDLIIVDIVMKERTEGFFTVQELRRTAELKTVPIFVLSSLYSKVTDFGVLPESGWLAHDEFIHKPADLAVLAEKIRQRIGKGAAEA